MSLTVQQEHNSHKLGILSQFLEVIKDFESACTIFAKGCKLESFQCFMLQGILELKT
jgi:hypothetical protein